MSWAYRVVWKTRPNGNPYQSRERYWVPPKKAKVDASDPKAEAQQSLKERRAILAKPKPKVTPKQLQDARSAAALLTDARRRADAKAAARRTMWDNLRELTGSTLASVVPPKPGSPGRYLTGPYALRAAGSSSSAPKVKLGPAVGELDPRDEQTLIRKIQGQQRASAANAAAKQAAEVRARDKRLADATKPETKYDPHSGRVLENLLLNAKHRQDASGGNDVSPEFTLKVLEAYNRYTEHVRKTIENTNTKLDRLTYKDKKGLLHYKSPEAQRKGEALLKSSRYGDWMKEAKFLWGPDLKQTTGSFVDAWKAFKAIGETQRDYVRDTARQVFMSEAKSGEDLKQKQQQWEDVEKWLYLATAEDIKDTDLGWKYTYDFASGGGQVKGVRRTVEEEFEFRQGQYRAEFNRRMAEVREQQIRVQNAYRNEQKFARDEEYVGARAKRDYEAIANSITALGLTGDLNDIGRDPKLRDKVIDDAMATWESKNARLFMRVKKTASGRLEPVFLNNYDRARYDKAREDFRAGLYKQFGAEPPGWLEGAFQLPGIKPVTQVLSAANSLPGTTFRLGIAWTNPGGSRMNLGIQFARLPPEIQRAAMNVTELEGDGIFGWLGKQNYQKGAMASAKPEEFVRKWIEETPEGHKWMKEYAADLQKTTESQNAAFLRDFYGEGKNIWDMLDAVAAFGAEPTTDPMVNLVSQFVLDPTVKLPFNFMTWGMRYVKAMEAARGVNKLMKVPKFLTTFQNLEEPFLRASKMGDMWRAKAAANGWDSKRLVEEILTDLADAGENAGADAVRKKMRELGLDKRQVSGEMVLTQVGQLLVDEWAKVGVDYEDMLAKATSIEKETLRKARVKARREELSKGLDEDAARTAAREAATEADYTARRAEAMSRRERLTAALRRREESPAPSRGFTPRAATVETHVADVLHAEAGAPLDDVIYAGPGRAVAHVDDVVEAAPPARRRGSATTAGGIDKPGVPSTRPGGGTDWVRLPDGRVYRASAPHSIDPVTGKGVRYDPDLPDSFHGLAPAQKPYLDADGRTVHTTEGGGMTRYPEPGQTAAEATQSLLDDEMRYYHDAMRSVRDVPGSYVKEGDAAGRWDEGAVALSAGDAAWERARPSRHLDSEVDDVINREVRAGGTAAADAEGTMAAVGGYRPAVVVHDAMFSPGGYLDALRETDAYKAAVAAMEERTLVRGEGGTTGAQVAAQMRRRELAQRDLFEWARQSFAVTLRKEGRLTPGGGGLRDGNIPWVRNAEGQAFTSEGGLPSHRQHIVNAPELEVLSGVRTASEAGEVISVRVEEVKLRLRLLQARARLGLVDKKGRPAEGSLTFEQYIEVLESISRWGVVRRDKNLTVDMRATEGSLVQLSELDFLRATNPESRNEFIPVGESLVYELMDNDTLGHYYESFSVLPGMNLGPGYETSLMSQILDPAWRAALGRRQFAGILRRKMFSNVRFGPEERMGGGAGPMEFRQKGAHLNALFQHMMLDDWEAFQHIRDGLDDLATGKITNAQYRVVLAEGLAMSNGGVLRLKKLGQTVRVMLIDDADNPLLRMWVVLETRAGVFWADSFMDAEGGFLNALVRSEGNALHPNLALAMIPFSPLARSLPVTHGFTGRLRPLAVTQSALYRPSLASWTDDVVLANFQMMYHQKAGPTAAVTQATQVIHYLMSRYGDTITRKHLTDARQDLSIMRSHAGRDATPQSRRGWAEFREAYIELRESARLAESGAQSTDVERAAFGKDFDDVFAADRPFDKALRQEFTPEMRELYDRLYWSGRITHDSAGLHTSAFFERMGNPKYQRGDDYLNYVESYYRHMARAGYEADAHGILKVVLEPQIGATSGDAYEVLTHMGQTTGPVKGFKYGRLRRFLLDKGFLKPMEEVIAAGKAREHVSESLGETELERVRDTNEHLLDDQDIEVGRSEGRQMFAGATAENIVDRARDVTSRLIATLQEGKVLAEGEKGVDVALREFAEAEEALRAARAAHLEWMQGLSVAERRFANRHPDNIIELEKALEEATERAQVMTVQAKEVSRVTAEITQAEKELWDMRRGTKAEIAAQKKYVKELKAYYKQIRVEYDAAVRIVSHTYERPPKADLDVRMEMIRDIGARTEPKGDSPFFGSKGIRDFLATMDPGERDWVILRLREDYLVGQVNSLMNEFNKRLMDMGSLPPHMEDQLTEIVNMIRRVPGGVGMLNKWAVAHAVEIVNSRMQDYVRHLDLFQFSEEAEAAARRVGRAGQSDFLTEGQKVAGDAYAPGYFEVRQVAATFHAEVASLDGTIARGFDVVRTEAGGEVKVPHTAERVKALQAKRARSAREAAEMDAVLENAPVVDERELDILRKLHPEMPDAERVAMATRQEGQFSDFPAAIAEVERQLEVIAAGVDRGEKVLMGGAPFPRWLTKPQKAAGRKMRLILKTRLDNLRLQYQQELQSGRLKPGRGEMHNARASQGPERVGAPQAAAASHTGFVANLHDLPKGWEDDPNFVYVGRSGKGQTGEWGNPFTLKVGATAEQRAEAVAKYREWILQQPNIEKRLEALRGKTLVCFCTPLACHGDVLAELANAARRVPQVTPPVGDSFAVAVPRAARPVVIADDVWSATAGDPASYPGLTVNHYTSSQSAEALKSQDFKARTEKSPYGFKNDDPNAPAVLGDGLYLSLDDSHWGKADDVGDLTPVSYRLADDIKILVIDSVAKLKEEAERVGVTLDMYGNQLADFAAALQKAGGYDGVSIIGSRQWDRISNGADRAADKIPRVLGGDQIVVWDPSKVTRVDTPSASGLSGAALDAAVDGLTGDLKKTLAGAKREQRLLGLVPDPVAESIRGRELSLAVRAMVDVGVTSFGKVIGAGASAVVVEGVYKGKAVAIRLQRGSRVAYRKEIGGLIQPFHQGAHGDVSWAVVPLAVNDDVTEAELAVLRKQARASGFDWGDDAVDNAGRLADGTVVILDPQGFSKVKSTGQRLEEALASRVKNHETARAMGLPIDRADSGLLRRVSRWPKDVEKAKKATRFIGAGVQGSSTDDYARALGGSDKVFEETDTVFVSVNGRRPGRIAAVVDGELSFEYRAIDDAIAARAKFVTDVPAVREGYNIGEQEVAEYLTAHGYYEVEPGLWEPPTPDLNQPFDDNVDEWFSEGNIPTDPDEMPTSDVSTPEFWAKESEGLPEQGPPGGEFVQDEADADVITVVWRGDDGKVAGILRMFPPDIDEAMEMGYFASLGEELGDGGQMVGWRTILVRPDVRRTGIATKMYDFATSHGYDVKTMSGQNVTQEGQAFSTAYKTRRVSPGTWAAQVGDAASRGTPIGKQPVIRSVEELTALVENEPELFMRWTPDLRADMQPGAHSSALDPFQGIPDPEIGISAMTVPAHRGTAAEAIISPRTASQYDLGPAYGDFDYRRGGRQGTAGYKRRTAWLVRGKVVGWGIDGEPLLDPESIVPVAAVSRKVVDDYVTRHREGTVGGKGTVRTGGVEPAVAGVTRRQQFQHAIDEVLRGAEAVDPDTGHPVDVTNRNAALSSLYDRMKELGPAGDAKVVPHSTDFVPHARPNMFDGPYNHPDLHRGGEATGFSQMDYGGNYRGPMSKIHVAADALNGQEILRIVDAVARDMHVTYKWVRSIVELIPLPAPGLVDRPFAKGGSQQGKFITAYPDPQIAAEFTRRLDEALQNARITGGDVAPTERRYAPDSPITHRYVADSGEGGERFAADGDYANNPDYIGYRNGSAEHLAADPDAAAEAAGREAAASAEPTAPPPPPEIPTAPNPLDLNSERIAMSTRALEIIGQMTEEEYIAREMAKAWRVRRVAKDPAARRAASARIYELEKVMRVIRWAKGGGKGSLGGTTSRRTRSGKVASIVGKRAKAAFAPRSIGPLIFSAGGGETEQGRSYFRMWKLSIENTEIKSRVRETGPVSPTYTTHGARVEAEMAKPVVEPSLAGYGYDSNILSGLSYTEFVAGLDQFDRSFRDAGLVAWKEEFKRDLTVRLRAITGDDTYTIDRWLSDRLQVRDVDHFDPALFEVVEPEVVRSIHVERPGELRTTKTDLKRAPGDIPPEVKALAEIVEQDVRAVIGRNKVLARYGIDPHAYAEAWKVLRRPLQSKRYSLDILRLAIEKASKELYAAGHGVDDVDWDELFEAERNRQFLLIRQTVSDQEALKLLNKLTNEMVGATPRQIIEEFERRYLMDEEIKEFQRPEVTTFQKRTLEEAAKYHLQVDDLNDKDQLIVGLGAHGQKPPYTNRAAMRKWLVDYGFWSPRTAEAIDSGKASWSIFQEEEFFTLSWGHPPEWADTTLLEEGGRLRDAVLFDEVERAALYRRWGSFTRNMVARFKTGDMSRGERARFLVEGSAELEVKPKRDLQMERQYVKERFGRLAYDKEKDQLIAFPELMTADELSAFIGARAVGNVPERVFQSVAEFDVFRQVAMVHIKRWMEKYPYAGATVTWADYFQLTSAISHDMLLHPIWMSRPRDSLGAFIRLQAAIRRAVVFTQVGFMLLNVADTGIKGPWSAFTLRSLATGARMSDDAAALTIKKMGWDPSGQLLHELGRVGTERMGDAFTRERSVYMVGGKAMVENDLDRVLMGAMNLALGFSELPAQGARNAENFAKLRLAQQHYDGTLAKFLKDGHPKEVAEALTIAFLNKEIGRLWPTAGNGPIEQLFNQLSPFASYQFKNRLVFIGELAQHPVLFNYFDHIGDQIEKYNREKWEKEHPGEDLPDYLARLIELPWAPGVFIDLGQISDAQRGFKSVTDLMEGKQTMQSLASQFVRLAGPNDINFVAGWANALDWGQRTGWVQIMDAEGQGTGQWEKVEVPWEAPWGGEANWLNSFWPVELGTQLEATIKGNWNAQELTKLIYQATFFGGLKEYDRGAGLNHFYFALKDKDPTAADEWLNNTDQGRDLRTWWTDKIPDAASGYTPQQVKDILHPPTADPNPWLHNQTPEYEALIKRDLEEMAHIRQRWDNTIGNLVYGSKAFSNALMGKQIERWQFINSHPELYDYFAASMSAKEWATQLDEWQVDDLSQTFYNLPKPERKDGESEKDWQKRLGVYNKQREEYLRMFPQVAERIAEARDTTEMVWKAVEDHWFTDILSKVGTTQIAIDAAQQAKNFSLADQLYLMKELQSEGLNEETALTYFDPAIDYKPLTAFDKERGRGPQLREGPFGQKLLPRAMIFPDMRAYLYDRADPAKRAKMDRDQKYAVLMSDVIKKAKASGNFAKSFVLQVKGDKWLREEYFRRNPGKREEWAQTDTYIRYMGKWHSFIEKGDWDGANRYFESLPTWAQDRYLNKNPKARAGRANQRENLAYMSLMKRWTDFYRRRDYEGGARFFEKLPQWAKERYYSKHPTGFGRSGGKGSSPYSRAMGKWVKLLQAGDKDGAKKYFESLPKEYKDRYYSTHPEAKIRDDIKRVGQLAQYFSADDANRVRYLEDNPGFAKWLKAQGNSEQTRRMLIMAGYRAIPSSEQWLKRVYREKYPEIFSKEAAGERARAKVLATLAEHPELKPGFEKWLDIVLSTYAEELKHSKAPPKPLEVVHQRQHGMDRRRPHSGKSAAWVRLHSLS